MSDDIRKEWRRAIWTIVAACIIALGTNVAQTWAATRTLEVQLKVLDKEQGALRTKVDLLLAQMEKKVDRETLDYCMSEIKSDIREIKNHILEIYKHQKQ